MNGRWMRRGLRPIAGFIFIFLPGLSHAASAATVWNGGSGAWSTNSKWTPNVVPNSSSTSVSIDGSTSIVSMTTTEAVNALSLTNAAQLAIQNGSTLTINSGVTLSGGATVNLGTPTSAGNLTLNENGAPQSMSGASSIVFSAASNQVAITGEFQREFGADHRQRRSHSRNLRKHHRGQQ